MQYGAHAQGRATITAAASASATLMAAVDGARLHITKGMVSVITAAGTGLGINFMETSYGGTYVATLFTVDHATTHVWNFDFGDKGWQASAVGSRFVIENTGDATVNALFVGYHR